MGYNPYKNYSKKLQEKARKEKEQQERLAREAYIICDGLSVEKIRSTDLKKMIQDTRGQGLNFTEPLAGWETVLSDKSEAPEQRIISGQGSDRGVYYYK